METNKILGAIILALLLAAAFSKIADMPSKNLMNSRDFLQNHGEIF